MKNISSIRFTLNALRIVVRLQQISYETDIKQLPSEIQRNLYSLYLNSL